jgi:hypothetical protein
VPDSEKPMLIGLAQKVQKAEDVQLIESFHELIEIAPEPANGSTRRLIFTGK